MRDLPTKPRLLIDVGSGPSCNWERRAYQTKGGRCDLTMREPSLLVVPICAACVLAACAVHSPSSNPYPANTQQMQELGRQAQALQRDPQALQQVTEALMGKPPVPEQPSTEGIQVVLQTGHAEFVNSVALSPDGRRVLSGGFDETARLWDVAARQEIRVLGGVGIYGAGPTVRFDPSGTRALLADYNGTRAYDLGSGAELWRTFSQWGTHDGK